MTHKTTQPEVTQADRDAAHDYLLSVGIPNANTLDGANDAAPLVQAFTRHRTEQSASPSGLVEALQTLVNACFAGRMIPKPGCGVGGMTIDANIRGSLFNGVDGAAVLAAQQVIDEAALAAPATAEGEQIAESANCSTPSASEPQPASNDAVREKLARWSGNLKITRDSPIHGDILHGAALDLVIEGIDSILASTPLPAADEQTGVDRTGEGLRLLREARWWIHEDTPGDSSWEAEQAFIARIDAYLATPVPTSGDEGLVRYRHNKRGTEYDVIGTAELQDAAGIGVFEGFALTIYRGDDGKIWAREQSEFEDGRFSRLSRPPANEVAPANGGEGA